MTVGDFQTAIARWNYSTSELYRKLNAVCKHLMNSDVYTDLFSILEINTATGFFTMPRAYGRAYGIIQDCLPQPILSQWQPFINLGLARFDPNIMGNGMRDLGNAFCTQSDVYANGAQQAGTLRVTISNVADAGKVIHFDGTSDGITRIFTAGSAGVPLTTTNPTQDTAVVFQSLDGIQAAANFLYPWTVSKVISGTPTVIGSYEPGETRPQYTRYNVSPGTVRVITRRKHVDLIALTDWIYPSNQGALEMGFQALSYRDRGDFAKEDEAWEVAKKFLKEEYAATVPYPEMYMSSDGFGASLNRFKWWSPRLITQVGDVSIFS